MELGENETFFGLLSVENFLSAPTLLLLLLGKEQNWFSFIIFNDLSTADTLNVTSFRPHG